MVRSSCVVLVMMAACGSPESERPRPVTQGTGTVVTPRDDGAPSSDPSGAPSSDPGSASTSTEPDADGGRITEVVDTPTSPPDTPAPDPSGDRPSARTRCKPGLCWMVGTGCVKVGYRSGAGGTGPCSSCTGGVCNATRCAAPTTPIDTPTGPRPIADLRTGDLVWSVDDHGHRVAAALARVSSTPVTEHRVVQLVLDDGYELLLSPGHPIASGALVGDLHVGDMISRRRIVSAELVPFAFAATHDILPATPSGIYFSGDIALGSTLRPAR